MRPAARDFAVLGLALAGTLLPVSIGASYPGSFILAHGLHVDVSSASVGAPAPKPMAIGPLPWDATVIATIAQQTPGWDRLDDALAQGKRNTANPSSVPRPRRTMTAEALTPSADQLARLMGGATRSFEIKASVNLELPPALHQAFNRWAESGR